MTALNGPILFNSSTGSDSLASGLGPATAVNSTTEGTTASYSTTTITFSGATDLSAVSAGDLLYLVTSTGRKFFAIASVNDGADSLTVDDTPTGTASGLSWAIGGKRQTLSHSDSYRLFDNGGGDGDQKGGWIIELQSGFADTISTIDWRGAGSLTDGGKILRGEAIAATKPIITFSGSANGVVFRGFYQKLSNVKLASSATKTGGAAIAVVTTGISVDRLTIVESGTNAWNYGVVASGAAFPGSVERCEIANCKTAGVGMATTGNQGGCNIETNMIRDNLGDGIVATGASYFGLTIYNNVIIGNAGNGITVNNIRTDALGQGTSICGNIVHDNAGDGIEIANWNASLATNVMRRNTITANGGYGINLSNASASASGASAYGVDANFNALGSGAVANTSGDRVNLNAGDDDITLTADPFVDAASGDFNINSTAGGGAALRAATITL